MKLGIVVGKVWADKKVPELKGCLLHVVQPVEANGNPIDRQLVVADPKNIAGQGDKIVYVTSTDAVQAFDSGFVPVNASVVELVDSVSEGAEMFLAKVMHAVTATEKHPAYKSKRVYVVRNVYPDGKDKGAEWVAVDYVGAGIGDIVVCGGAPGVAQEVFKLKMAPIRTLIMAIVDSIEYRDIK